MDKLVVNTDGCIGCGACDGPLRRPYTAFLQGGLTFESSKLAILHAIDKMITERKN